jgi:hypothetical protein
VLSQTSSAPTEALAPGTVLSAELSKWLDAKKCRVNDRIEAKTVNDLLVNGQLVVPRNTRIIGHITEAKVHSKISPGSTLGLEFDQIVLKNGHEVPLLLTIQALAPPRRTSSIGSGPDSLADRMTTPNRLPPVGAQAPPAGSSSLPSEYPDNIPSPPSTNAGGPSNSTVTPLSSTSRGVVGIRRLMLDASGPVSIFRTSGGNVRLESGTQLTLRVQ